MMNLLMAQAVDSTTIDSTAMSSGDQMSSTEFLIVLGIVFGVWLVVSVLCVLMNKLLKIVGNAPIDSYELELMWMPMIHIVSLIYLLFLLIFNIPDFFKVGRNKRKTKRQNRAIEKQKAIEDRIHERLKNIIDL